MLRRYTYICPRNVVVAGQRTSVRLEPEMWDALQEISSARRITVNELVGEIARECQPAPLTASIRVFLLSYFRRAALLERTP